MNTAEALRPINRAFQLFGLSVTPPCKLKNISSNWVIKCYSFLCIALRITSFFYSVGAKQFFKRADALVCGFSPTVDVASMCGIRLLEITILIEAFVKIRHEKQLMRNFLEIDNIFVHHFNVDLKPNELRRSIIKRFIIWASTFGVIVAGILFLAHTRISLLLYYSMHTISFTTASFTYFQIITWTDLIRYRLRIINRLINNINNEYHKILHQKYEEIIVYKSNGKHFDRKANGVRSTVDSIYESKIFDQFGIICDVYDRLWTQTRLVNERFKYSMVFNIGNDFVLLVSNIYFTFECLRHHPCSFATVFIGFLSTILNIFHISMLCRTCHHTAHEAKLIAHGIHKNSMVISNKRFNSFVSVLKFPLFSL